MFYCVLPGILLKGKRNDFCGPPVSWKNPQTSCCALRAIPSKPTRSNSCGRR